MTHEEAIEQIQSRLAALARFTAEVTLDIRRELDALKQPQEPQMTQKQAIEKAKAELAHFVTESEYTDYCTLDDGRICSVDFYRKPPKTTCVLRINEQRVAVGRSWCARGDKLNLYIGELIALYRALGREVPAWLLHIPQE